MLSSANPTLPGTGLRSMISELAPAARRPARSRALPAIVLSIAGAALLAVLISTHGASFVHAIDRAFHASWQLVVLAALLEAASVAGYVLLLHRVVSSANARLRLKDSYDITLGGAAATRLLPTAGLGGAAVTVWALRARGVRPSELAERLLAFMLLLYGVYLAALFAGGAVVALGLVKVSAGRGVGLLGASLASLRRSVAGWRKDRVVVAAPADARSPYRSRTLSRRQYGHDIRQLQGATNVAH